jgi:hypothetical protein
MRGSYLVVRGAGGEVPLVNLLGEGRLDAFPYPIMAMV